MINSLFFRFFFLVGYCFVFFEDPLPHVFGFSTKCFLIVLTGASSLLSLPPLFSPRFVKPFPLLPKMEPLVFPAVELRLSFEDVEELIFDLQAPRSPPSI